MSELKIEVDALMNDKDFIAAATRMQVQMDRLDTLSQKTGLSKSALNKALAAEEKALNASSTAMQKSTMSITDFRSAYQIAMDVVRVGQQVYAQTINVAQEYDQKVRDMMLSTGGTADETSRLIQVVDDAGVSFDVLKVALKAASKDGVEGNIESIAKLAEQYQKLAPGVERNNFLMDTFGTRTGPQMAKVLSLTKDELMKMSAEMEGGLVLTQDNIDASEEWRKNLDKLDDSINSAKISLGNKLIPIINQGIENQEDYNRRLQETIRLYGDNGDRANNMRVLLMQESEERIKAADAVAEHGDKLDGIVTSYKEAEDALVNLNSSYGDLLKNAMSLTSTDQDFAESQQDIKDQQAELMTEKAGLYAWETKEIETIQGKIDDLSVKYDENAKEHEKRTQRVLLDMSIEKIAMSDGEAGFSEAEYNKALALAETAGAAEAAAIREAAAMDATSTAIAKGTVEIDKFKQMYDLLTSKEITLTVNQVTNMLRADTLAEQMDNRQQHATGGDFLIPMSYGNEGFRMGNGDTASGGERVTISPRGGSPNADVIAAIERNRVSEERLVQLFENAVLRVMK